MTGVEVYVLYLVGRVACPAIGMALDALSSALDEESGEAECS